MRSSGSSLLLLLLRVALVTTCLEAREQRIRLKRESPPCLRRRSPLCEEMSAQVSVCATGLWSPQLGEKTPTPTRCRRRTPRTNAARPGPTRQNGQPQAGQALFVERGRADDD